MLTTSAGLLMFRRGRQSRNGLEVLLVHPGGPFWKNRDAGAWTIPKGEVETGEDVLAAAKREFAEETGIHPAGEFVALTPIKQKGGKIVYAWAIEGDMDPAIFKSNTFVMEWPPKSGKRAEFPEVDRAEFFSVELAEKKINPAQVGFIIEIEGLLGDKAG